MATVWAVGDSLTFGVSWPADTPGGWRVTVADALPDLVWVGSSEDNPAPGHAGLRHDGHPGWRVDQIAGLLADGPRCDVLVVQGGSNDVIQRWAPGEPWHQTYDEFDEGQRAVFAAGLLERYDALLAAAVAHAPTVVSWTVPPIGPGGAYYGSPSVADVNAAIPAVCARHGVLLADVSLALAPDGALTPGHVGVDGVHPTPAGYRVIAGVLAGVIAPLVAAR